MADVNERQEFFINAAQKDDDDELLDELDALEAEMIEDDFNDVEIGSGAIKGAAGQQAVQAKPQAASRQQDEADLLAQMMA